MPFFFIFVVIPLMEIMVFMAVSDQIGLGTSLLLALLTAIIGGFLVKYQGIYTLMSAQESMNRGVLPTKELFDGLCIVAAGATLITPGFITDVIGFSLLVPPIRNYIREKVSNSDRFKSTGFQAGHAEFHDMRGDPRPHAPDVIEAEYETVEDKDKE